MPDSLHAHAPAEYRGLGRDGVKLLVTDRQSGSVAHARFSNLPDLLDPGDLLVLNTSATLPAALPARWAEQPLEVRLAQRLDGRRWWGLLLRNGRPITANPLLPGFQLSFDGGLVARVVRHHPEIAPLWLLRFSEVGSDLLSVFYRIGQPIRYKYVSTQWPLDAYQNVYATQPGSAEMPSAGRALTWEMLFRLRRGGIQIATLLLHTGLSSYLDDAIDRQHPTSDEKFAIGAKTVSMIRTARANGHRVIAVGTTVVRALESITMLGPEGPAHRYASLTNLRITRDHQLQVVDALLTGLHEPEASHLDLLSAFLRPEIIEHAYREAISRNYLWHEFGDVNLIL